LIGRLGCSAVGVECYGKGFGDELPPPPSLQPMIAIAIMAIAIPKNWFLVFMLVAPLILMLSFGQIYPLKKCV